jgi:hypothetical protein
LFNPHAVFRKRLSKFRETHADHAINDFYTIQKIKDRPFSPSVADCDRQSIAQMSSFNEVKNFDLHFTEKQGEVNLDTLEFGRPVVITVTDRELKPIPEAQAELDQSS